MGGGNMSPSQGPLGQDAKRVNPSASGLGKSLLTGTGAPALAQVWHYLPDRWSGAAASNLYRKVVVKALKKYRPHKTKYVLVEDNDPTGYKSAAGKQARLALKCTSPPTVHSQCLIIVCGTDLAVFVGLVFRVPPCSPRAWAPRRPSIPFGSPVR